MRYENSEAMRLYQREFFIHQAIEALASHNNIEPLTSSQARAVRAQIDELLRGHGLTVGSDRLDDRAITSAFDTASQQVLGELNPMFTEVDAATGKKRYSESGLSMLAQINNNFGAYTGFSQTGQEPQGGFRLPISPYDPRFSSRAVSMNAGTKLLALPADDVDRLAENIYTGAFEYDRVANYHDVDNPVALYSLNYTSTDDRDAYEGSLWRREDALGLAGLRPYMTYNEYKDALSWMEADTSGTVITPDMAARAQAVLRYLGEEGIEYSVQRDKNPGQLKVRLTDSNLDIRLVDKDESFIGRVYDNGIAVYFTPKPDDGVQFSPVTPRETVDLVKFVRGEEVRRHDNPDVVVGTAATDGYNQGGKAARYTLAPGKQIYFNDKHHTTSKVYFDTYDKNTGELTLTAQQKAEPDLQQAIEQARDKMLEQIDVEGLVAEYRRVQADPEMSIDDYTPDFVGDETIAGLREAYWSALVGRSRLPIDPGFTEEEYREAYDEAGKQAVAEASVDGQDVADDVYADGAKAGTAHMTTAADLMETDPVGALMRHSQLSVDNIVGSYEPDANGVRFNPNRVAMYMDTTQSQWRNLDGILSAIRTLDIPADELRGDEDEVGLIADRLITFDEESAYDIAGPNTPDDVHPVLKTLSETIDETLRQKAIEPVNIQIDDQGIIRWVGNRRVQPGNASAEITGHIGQVFLPDMEHGGVTTNYAGSENHMFFPGYEARVLDQKPGENLSLEERTRLVGFEQRLNEAVREQLVEDVMGVHTTRGNATSVNKVYRSLYGHKYPVDFFERSAEEGMSEAWREAISQTELRRVLYPKEFRDQSTMMAANNFEKRTGGDEYALRNDNSRDPYVRSGKRNMSIIDAEAAPGVFDPDVTATASGHGVVRYLVEGASVDKYGNITPSLDADDRVPLMKHPDTWAMEFNPHDRRNMTVSNLLQASRVTGQNVKTAMAQIGGWNKEDAIVVSQEFADAYPIRDAEGNMRPLRPGDKLSDFHGNKGVISLVVDPAMDSEVAREAGIWEQVDFFRQNPDLEVVMSPFSPISRLNMGTSRELLQNPQTLRVKDDNGVWVDREGHMGDLNFIVTHMAVDIKTNEYDAEAVAIGKGRKVSNQLVWGLQQHDATAVMDYLFANNTSSLETSKEVLVALGLDLDELGQLQVGMDQRAYDVDNELSRKRFVMPELEYNSGNGALNVNAMRNRFGEEIAKSGGIMELPFALEMRTGAQTPQLENGTYAMPVMSARLRNNQELIDGSVVKHDFTQNYMAIFDAAARYQHVAQGGKLRQQDLKDVDKRLPQPQRELIARERLMESCKAQAQAQYDIMSSKLTERYVEGKRNMFKESVMGHRVPNSATAVWHPNPNLDIDAVAVSPSMANTLGVKEGDYTMMWRDPVLRGAGVSYMRVTIDPDLVGVQINPAIAAMHDGDFDGDSVGLVGNLKGRAHYEAMEKFSIGAKMLDLGSFGKKGEFADGSRRYELAIADNLDLEVARKAGLFEMDRELAAHPQRYPEGEPVDFFDDAADRANDIYADIANVRAQHAAGEMPFEDYTTQLADHLKRRDELLYEINDQIQGGYENQSKNIYLDFSSPEAHIESCRDIYRVGGKGSESKIGSMLSYAGFEDQGDGTYTMHEHTLSTQRDNEESQYAMCSKDAYTGVAGKHSQHAIQYLRAQGEVGAANEVARVATQGLLSAKHSAADAKRRVFMVDTVLRNQWSGYALDIEPDADGNISWDVITDEQGNPVQASAGQWAKQMQEIICNDQGMGDFVGVNQINRVARALSDENGYILNTERENWQSWPEHKRPLALDQLITDAKFDDLVGLAHQRANLYEGINAHCAPRALRQNWRVQEKNLALEAAGHAQDMEFDALQALGVNDVKRDYIARKSARKSQPVARGDIRLPEDHIKGPEVKTPAPEPVGVLNDVAAQRVYAAANNANYAPTSPAMSAVDNTQPAHEAAHGAVREEAMSPSEMYQESARRVALAEQQQQRSVNERVNGVLSHKEADTGQYEGLDR
jgi:hypothetical protein